MIEAVKNFSTPFTEWPETRLMMSALGNRDEARFVGGAVRDMLLGKMVEDIDIATVFTPSEVMARCSEVGIKVIPTGIDHGTVTAVIGKRHFEITTLRRDKACDGRHATVEFSNDWKEDAARRDFTFNALYLDMEGNSYDYFGGKKDLKLGMVKFIGSTKDRIEEDYLRILRFFRFFARFGSDLAANHPTTAQTIEVIKSKAGGLKNLSSERVRGEILKLFASDYPVFAVRMMESANIFETLLNVLPKKNAILALERLLKLEVEIGFFTESLLRLAVYLVPYTEEETKAMAVSKQLKFSKKESQLWQQLISPPFSLSADSSEKQCKAWIREYGSDVFILQAMAFLSRSSALSAAEEKKILEVMQLAASWQVPEFPLKGADIKKLGIKEGKALGEYLKLAEKYWEENEYTPSKLELVKFTKSKL